jgi:hypothetical protein
MKQVIHQPTRFEGADKLMAKKKFKEENVDPQSENFRSHTHSNSRKMYTVRVHEADANVCCVESKMSLKTESGMKNVLIHIKSCCFFFLSHRLPRVNAMIVM